MDWKPPSRVEALLYSDGNGTAANSGYVIEEAREDGRWPDLVRPVAELMRDEQLHPLWRWVACTALLEWADPAGYDAVLQACSAPSRVVWLGVATDRFTGGDTTFAELAEAMGESKELAEERGTAPMRLDALRALLGIADQVDLVHSLDDGICGALRDDDVPALQSELHAAILQTAARQDPPFDTGVQAAGLIGVLARVDEPEAVRLARQLVRTHLYRDVLVWLGGVVGNGRGEESLLFADELVEAGRTLGVDPRVHAALNSRRYMANRSAN